MTLCLITKMPRGKQKGQKTTGYEINHQTTKNNTKEHRKKTSSGSNVVALTYLTNSACKSRLTVTFKTIASICADSSISTRIAVTMWTFCKKTKSEIEFTQNKFSRCAVIWLGKKRKKQRTTKISLKYLTWSAQFSFPWRWAFTDITIHKIKTTSIVPTRIGAAFIDIYHEKESQKPRLENVYFIKIL